MSSLVGRFDEALKHAPDSLREAFAMFDVVETEGVATAEVTGRAVPVVKVNPRFVEEHCPTPQSLAALLMHEALHVVLGHTSRGGGTTVLDNLVWDAVINSMLCRMRPEPEWTALFTSFYSESDPVECFLRPAPGFDPSRAVALPSVLAPKPRSRGASLYRSLYGRRGVPESDLRAYLAARVPTGLFLLGGHGEGIPGAGRAAQDEEESERTEEEGSGRQIARDVLRDFRKEVEEASGRGGRGTGGTAGRRRVTLEAAPRRILASLVRRIAGRELRFDGTLSRRDTGDFEVLGILPAPDRRSVLWRGAGASPLLFRRAALEPATRRSGERVHLYLDVSGSIESLLGKLYSAVRDVADLVGRDVHLFSTDVVDVPMKDLAKGVCQTTGGTSLLPVVRHIRENGVRRAVIVTDGEVGYLGARDEETLRETILGVALTSERQKDGDLARLARRVVVLPGLESGRGPDSFRRREGETRE